MKYKCLSRNATDAKLGSVPGATAKIVYNLLCKMDGVGLTTTHQNN
jgi:hypothetical protein